MMLGGQKQESAEAVSNLFTQHLPFFHVNIQEDSMMVKCAQIVSKLSIDSRFLAQSPF